MTWLWPGQQLKYCLKFDHDGQSFCWSDYQSKFTVDWYSTYILFCYFVDWATGTFLFIRLLLSCFHLTDLHSSEKCGKLLSTVPRPQSFWCPRSPHWIWKKRFKFAAWSTWTQLQNPLKIWFLNDLQAVTSSWKCFPWITLSLFVGMRRRPLLMS